MEDFKQEWSLKDLDATYAKWAAEANLTPAEIAAVKEAVEPYRPSPFTDILYVSRDWCLGDAPDHIRAQMTVGDGFLDLHIEAPLWWWNGKERNSGWSSDQQILAIGRYKVVDIQYGQFKDLEEHLDPKKQWWTCKLDRKETEKHAQLDHTPLETP